MKYINDPDCPFCKLDVSGTEPSFIHEFGHSYACVDWDQRYKGAAILVLKNHYEDLTAIPNDEYVSVMAELRLLAGSIIRTFDPDKVNYLLLGNGVHHLHWYIIPRYEGDESWGGSPLFKRGYPKLSPDAYRELSTQIRANIKE